jgi:hypothetical protein
LVFKFQKPSGVSDAPRTFCGLTLYSFSISPSRVSLVVTETVDAGLLGEGILQTLIHAWESLLLPPGSKDEVSSVGRVVPEAAGVWIVPIECLHIARKYRFLKPDITQENFSTFLQVMV